MEKLYSLLKKDFGLKDKHILIVKALENEESKAENLCKITNIPQGRIYEYLNTLVEQGVVQRSHKKPYLYTIKDLKKNVLWFTKQKIDNMVQAQDEMINQFKQSDNGDVTLINSPELYTQTHCNVIQRSKIFRTIDIYKSFPYLLYPDNLKIFLEMRKVITHVRPTITKGNEESAALVFKCYMDSLKRGHVMDAVIDKKTFDQHMDLFEKYFKKEKWIRVLENMINKLKKYNANIYILDEFNAMQIDINEKEVCLCVNYSSLTSGFHIRSKELARFFNRVFLDKMKRADSVLPILEEKLKVLKG